jgi:methionine-rich copper-binding protein CopC
VLIATFLITIVGILPVTANSTPQTIPFSQDWSDTGLITANDNWTAVPGIVGYLGDNLTATTGTDPQTVLVDGSSVDVIADQTDPALSQGGVAEFGIANPVVALQGTSSADAPNVVIALNTVGQSNVYVSFVLRDIDGTTDNAVQPVAVQYRVGATGTYTNLPAGFVADATSGPSLADVVTPVEVGLPAAANDQAIVHVRIITTNAGGNDEWVGIDDIAVVASPDDAPVVRSTTPAVGATDVAIGSDLTVTFSEPVAAAAGWFTIVCRTSGAHAAGVSGGPTTFTLDPTTDFTHVERCTLTVRATAVTDQDSIDPPDRIALDHVMSFTTTAADDGPAVTATTPADGATDVAVSTDLSITFSEPVDLAAGWYSVVCGTSGVHAADVSGGPMSFALDPTSDFVDAETCTLNVHAAGVTDQDADDPPDAMAGDLVMSFTMAAPPDTAPTVVATTPADGATDIPVGTALGITFDEPVDLGAGWQSIACGTSGTHTALVSGGPTVFGLDPEGDLVPSETCTLTIHAAHVTDQDTDDPPDAMSTDAVVAFTTAAPPDDAPSVVATAPADGATNVALGTDVSVTFDEPVAVTGTWFTIQCTDSGAHVATVTGGPTTYTLDATTDLAQGESCTVTVIAAGVTDQDATDPPDTMAADTSFGFATVEAAPTVNAPPTVGAGGPYTVVEGGSVAVSATGSDPDGDPISYAWDLDGDGTFETSGQTATFSAAGIGAPASRTISVRGSDPGGLSDTGAAKVEVVWPTGGFGPPIGGGPRSNEAKAGAVIPVKFSLGGNRGLDILRDGYPATQAYACGTTPPGDANQPTTSVGPAGLRYDPSTDMYSYQWKTDKTWTGTCRVFVVGLRDGTNLSVGLEFR